MKNFFIILMSGLLFGCNRVNAESTKLAHNTYYVWCRGEIGDCWEVSYYSCPNGFNIIGNQSSIDTIAVASNVYISKQKNEYVIACQ